MNPEFDFFCEETHEVIDTVLQETLHRTFALRVLGNPQTGPGRSQLSKQCWYHNIFTLEFDSLLYVHVSDHLFKEGSDHIARFV